MSNDPQNRIAELEQEIHELYDDLENLQDEIMKKDAIILELSEAGGSKKSASKALKKHVAIEVEEKDKEIRELKNKMGFLRKEKMDLERELKKYTEKRSSTVIPIEEKKTPLKSLVDELQIKLKKLRTENNSLKKQLDTGISPEVDKSLNQKDDEIKMLKKKISDLTNKSGMQRISAANKKSSSISSDLTSELQNKLNKAKIQIETLKNEIEQKTKGKDKKEIENLKHEIEDLKYQLVMKEKGEKQPTTHSPGQFSGLSTELQEKLNTARRQIKNLRDQLKNYETAGGSQITAGADFKSQELQENIRKLKEENSLLNKKIKEQEHILSVKEERIISLSEKAKKPSLYDKPIKIDENTPIPLRVRELSSMIEELKKQNVEQRIEISELRRK